MGKWKIIAGVATVASLVLTLVQGAAMEKVQEEMIDEKVKEKLTDKNDK